MSTREELWAKFEEWCLPDSSEEYEPGYWRCWEAAYTSGSESQKGRLSMRELEEFVNWWKSYENGGDKTRGYITAEDAYAAGRVAGQREMREWAAAVAMDFSKWVHDTSPVAAIRALPIGEEKP